jgi:hypothetical protein
MKGGIMSDMKRAILPVVALIGISGCGGGDGTPTPKGTGANQPAAKQVQAGQPSRGGAGFATQIPEIPTDARYSIECAYFSGSDHVQQARLMKDRMIQEHRRKDFYVVHNEGFSVLYLGYYKAIDRNVDAAEAKRSTDDIEWLSQIAGPTGGRMFSRPLKVPIATANPDAPADWDLTSLDPDKDPNDPDRRFWTIVIAAYTNDVLDENGRPGDRKKMAVDSVREARKQGVEAYFYHGESMSQVSVGAWPRRAIREQDMASAESRSEAKANSGEALIVSTAPLGQKRTEQLENSGKVIQPKVVFQDPTLAKALNHWAQFPYSVNAVVQTVTVTDPVTKKQTVRDQPPFLAQIPQVQKSLIADRPTFDQPTPTMINPLGPGTGTTGGLRGMER